MVDGFFLSLDFRVKIVKMQRVKFIIEFLDITYIPNKTLKNTNENIGL